MKIPTIVYMPETAESISTEIYDSFRFGAGLSLCYSVTHYKFFQSFDQRYREEGLL